MERQAGIDALKPITPPEPASGKPPQGPCSLEAGDRDQPPDLGYGFANESAVFPAARPVHAAGIRFGDDPLRRLLPPDSDSVHRPEHSRKGKRDENAYDKAKVKLRRLKKSV